MQLKNKELELDSKFLPAGRQAKFKIKNYLPAAVSGVLLALAYPPYDIPGLIWIGIIPLFFVLENISRIVPPPPRSNPGGGGTGGPISVLWRVFLIGATAGSVYFAFVYGWLFGTYPLDWARVESAWTGMALVGAIWALNAVLANGIVWGFFAVSVVYIKSNKKVGNSYFLTEMAFPVLVYPILWIIFEYLRSIWFSIIFSGPGALIGPHWTTGHLGYALHDNFYLLQSADFWGIYGLGFLIVFVNAILFLAIKSLFYGSPHGPRRSVEIRVAGTAAGIAGIVIIIAGVGVYGHFRVNKITNIAKNSEQLNIALIQTDFSSTEIADPNQREKIRQTQTKLLKIALEGNPDLIVFPEDSRFLNDTQMWDVLRPTLAREDNLPFLIIDNARAHTVAGVKSRVFYFDSENGLITKSDKLLLVPFGEYLPYIIRWPASILKQDYWLTLFESMRAYVPGKAARIADTRFGGIATMVCSEPLSPSLVRALAKLPPKNDYLNSAPEADILINIASEAVFHGSHSYITQNMAVLKIRAVETRKFIAQATNGGPSFMISATGQIIDNGPVIDGIIFRRAAIIR